MDRVCIHKATGKLLEMQAGGDDRHDLMPARLETLKINAINAGYKEDEIECKWATNEETAVLTAIDPSVIAEREALRVARETSVADALPSWSAVSAKIDACDTIAKLRAVVKQMARIMYLDIKNSID